MLSATFVVDTDKNGLVRKTTGGGHYRGSVQLHADGRMLMEVVGFRIDAAMNSITAPVSVTKNGAYPIARISPEWSADLLRQAREQIKRLR